MILKSTTTLNKQRPHMYTRCRLRTGCISCTGSNKTSREYRPLLYLVNSLLSHIVNYITRDNPNFSDNQADVIKAFNSTSRYLDDLLNIDNPYFEGMVNQIYPSELQLNKANTSDTEAPFLDLHLSISNGFVSSKIYDKRDDFDFDIVNFPFLDGDVPRRPSYGVYISQLIRFARVCSHVDDFNTRNKCLTAKLLKQGYRYHKLRKAFSKFYRRHYELISKFNVG